jgi:hypothetical protein
VQIEEGAGVSAFPGGEPLLIRRGGYGAVAAEADGVAGSIFTVAVLEVEAVGGELKMLIGHRLLWTG